MSARRYRPGSWIHHGGRQITVFGLARLHRVSCLGLVARLNAGVPVDAALVAPSLSPAPSAIAFTVDGKTATLAELAAAAGVPYNIAAARVRQGWEPSKATTMPVGPAAGRRARSFTVGGKTATLAEHALDHGLSVITVRMRMTRKGMSVEAALAMPVTPRGASSTAKARTFTIAGKTATMSEHARDRGLKVVTIHGRLHRGWDLESAITTPVVGRPAAPGASS